MQGLDKEGNPKESVVDAIRKNSKDNVEIEGELSESKYCHHEENSHAANYGGEDPDADVDSFHPNVVVAIIRDAVDDDLLRSWHAAAHGWDSANKQRRFDLSTIKATMGVEKIWYSVVDICH